MNKQTAQWIEKHFDTAFAAPDGIKKLRELILTLAMQGRLVPQDPNDQPASELLMEIEAEKRRLVKEGKIKAAKPLPEIKVEDVPYGLPEGWEWVRLPECYYGIGSKRNQIQTKDYLESGIFPVIDQGKAYIAAFYNGKDKLLKIERPVLVFGDHTKIIKYIDFDFVIGADGVKILCPYEGVSTKFIYRLLQSYNLENRGYARHFKVLNEEFVPLPPLPEQHRIVAKIDQLMARCDELEKLRAEQEQKRLAVHTSAIKRLLDAQAKNSFDEAWQFITRHFGTLYSVKGNVTELRKAILQLAVMGKLVPQDPSDPPASELLKEIEAEKRRLVKEGKMKSPKPLPEINPEEVTYDVPNGWGLIRFADLVTEIATGPFGTMIHKNEYIESGVPLINPSHMINGEIVHDPTISVTIEKAKELNSYTIIKGDIVMARRGEMGRCAIVDSRSNHWLCGTGSFVLRFIPSINRRYILNLFRTDSIRHYLGGNSVGTTMTNLNHGILNKMPVLLPPLPEQQRIVAKIDQLIPFPIVNAIYLC